MMGEAGPLVLVIHGTWGGSAPFLEPDSALTQQLRAAIGPAGEVRRFGWSGRNRFDARIAAAEELRRRILAEPSRPVTLVAHSHGGFVALKALEDAQAAARVDRVILLAAPFLHFELSPQHHLLDAFVNFLAVAVVCLLFAHGMALWLDVSAWIGVIGAFGALVGAAANQTLPQAAAQENAARLNLKPVAGPSLLILRHPGDEVGALFGAASLLRLILSLIGSLPLRLAPALMIAGYLAFLAVFFLTQGFVSVDFRWMIGLTLLLYVLFKAIAVADWAARMVFGVDLPGLTRGLSVHADSVPFSGTFRFQLSSQQRPGLRPAPDPVTIAAANRLFRQRRFIHQTIYEDPDILAAIAAFLHDGA